MPPSSRSQPKQHFLCDSMREHHRLRELGVLSQSEYEQSKAHILAQHSGSGGGRDVERAFPHRVLIIRMDDETFYALSR